MSKFSNILKKGLLLLILVMLFLPMAQNKINIFEIEPLKGDVEIPTEVNVNLDSLYKGVYQQEQDVYLNSMFGLRNFFVRLNNQLLFSLFHKPKASGVVIGKETYLYEKSYIDAYTGTDFLGEDSINHTLNRWKFINDTLSKLNKQLIIVFAAGKASFYPEYIPDNYIKASKPNTNYKSLSQGAQELGLHTIDFNKWFIDNKYKAKYPLYPQHGVHWSSYGTALAADSLIKKIEYLRNIDMPNVKINSITMAPAHGIDYDIADGMNLLNRFKSFEMAYPNVTIENKAGKTTPNVLVISDSFYWGMYNFGIDKCFGNQHFWYYNKQVYPETATKELLVDDIDFKKEIENHDVFIIMATESTLRKISWGFTEELEILFKPKSEDYFDKKATKKRVKEIVEYIKADKKWLEDTKQRAIDKKISTDSALVLEALWQIQIKK